MSSNVHIVLLTMVKNEEKNVKRLINSVRGWIDGVVLCDTGSTDKTVSLTNSILGELKLPGKVYEYPWENFGKSRTKSFESFQDWVAKHTSWDPSTVWGLLLDGDMILNEEGNLHSVLAGLDANIGGVQIPQRNGNLIYKNTRLVRASANWRCVGSTHEYWECTNGKGNQALEFPIITDIGDGGCKSDKYERDARLLEEDLKTDPNNVRTHFYLGQTYMSINRQEDAIKMFTRRIQLGGWEEEMYIAYIYKGDCLRALGRPLEAVDEWMRAWQLRQHRTEAALKIINFYRLSSKHNFMAMIFIEKLIQLQLGETLEGLKICAPVKNNDSLFVSHTDMTYSLWEELGIIAFYTGKIEGARFRLDTRILNGALNFDQRNRLTDLYRWYKWKLPVLKEYKINIGGDNLEFLKDETWRAYNPTIYKEADRYLVNLRHGNYETTDAKNFKFRNNNDSVVMTRNVIVEFNSNFEVLTDKFPPAEFKIPDKHIVNNTTRIHGLEDCRWIGTNSLLGTSRQFTPSELNKMVRIDVDKKTKTLVRMKPMMCPIASEEGNCQKNWLPFLWKGEECYVYHLNPFRVFTMKGALISSWASKKGVSFDGLRGSAPPVAWSSTIMPKECLVLIAHYSYYGGEGRRYYHRFLTLDGDLQPSRLSKTFTIAGEEAIQYVSGMCESLNSGSYIITYGVNDCNAFASEVDIKVIEEALIYKL